jgi:single-stranded-DNA-specific exonuclease
MKGMEAAVGRILAAVERGERVAVYGDYDIDGITATATLSEGLRAQGLEVECYIPDRFEEGYGINQKALEGLAERGIALVISVDCGITSVREAAWAREHGLDLIITDHHAVPEVVPEAVAVLNPKQPDDDYPCKDLAGVGVAFKLVQALAERTGCPSAGQVKWFLDLVALGTVCDVVKLVDENRALVHFGLKVLAKTRRPGLRALAEVASVDLAQVRSHHLGFMLGPRMNAAGRLEHANASLELLQTADAERARQLAVELDALNHQRRADQQRIVEAAEEQARAYMDSDVLVLAGEDWSHGVVGIVASKLVERWARPVMVAQIMGEKTKGSARSVPGFHLVEALWARPEIFDKFGGHAFAAGFTLPTERLDDLRQHMNEYWRAHQPADDAARMAADVEAGDLEQLNWSMLNHFAMLEPFGSGNPEPLIELHGVRADQAATMGTSGQHLRMTLRDDVGGRMRSVGFGMGERLAGLERSPLRVRGYLNINEYQGAKSLQLMIKEILL